MPTPTTSTTATATSSASTRAFLVHNDRTYPTLCRLFADLGIATRDTDMSMSVRDDDDRAGVRRGPRHRRAVPVVSQPGPAALPADARARSSASTARPPAARRRAGTADGEPLGAFVERHGFSDYFVEHFMTPLVAAVWSCAPGEAMRYPARYLFVFLQHHGMLSVFGSPTWRTVVGGSATYVEAIADRVHEVAAGMPVRAVQRVPDGVLGHRRRRRTASFDAAVIATHPDQALAMLADADPGRARRARRDSVLDQPRAAAHRRLRAAAPTAGPRVVELPRAHRTPTTCW